MASLTFVQIVVHCSTSYYVGCSSFIYYIVVNFSLVLAISSMDFNSNCSLTPCSSSICVDLLRCLVHALLTLYYNSLRFDALVTYTSGGIVFIDPHSVFNFPSALLNCAYKWCNFSSCTKLRQNHVISSAIVWTAFSLSAISIVVFSISPLFYVSFSNSVVGTARASNNSFSFLILVKIFPGHNTFSSANIYRLMSGISL